MRDFLGTGEAAVVVGDIQTTVACTLKGTEDTGTSGGAAQTNIQQSAERRLALGVSLNVVLLTVNLLATLILQTQLAVDTTGQQQTDAVSGGVVGQTDLQTVAGELVGVRSHEAHIVGHVSGEDLANDIAV